MRKVGNDFDEILQMRTLADPRKGARPFLLGIIVLKPPPAARHEAGGLDVFPLALTKVLCVAQKAGVRNTHVGRKLPRKVVSQTVPQAHIIDATTDAPLLNIAEGNERFAAALQNEPLGQQPVVLGFKIV